LLDEIGYDHLRVQDVADRAEGMRLLYVATTRARDHLVVSMHHVDGTKCHAAEIERVDVEHHLPWRIEVADPDLTAKQPTALQLSWDAETPPAPMSGTERDAWWRARRAAVGRQGGGAPAAATSRSTTWPAPPP